VLHLVGQLLIKSGDAWNHKHKMNNLVLYCLENCIEIHHFAQNLA